MDATEEGPECSPRTGRKSLGELCVQAVEPPKVRTLKINVILKVIVKGGRRRQLALILGFAGAILDIGRHVVSLEQKGAVGHVGFLLGGLRENKRGFRVWSIGSVGGGRREKIHYGS